MHSDFRPYDVRHSFAARYVAAGAVLPERCCRSGAAGAVLQVEAKQLGHCSESMVIKLYGRFRVNTAALANVESVATSGGAIRRPSAAARQAAQPGEDGRAAADTSVPRDMSAATPRTVETTGASLDPSASG